MDRCGGRSFIHRRSARTGSRCEQRWRRSRCWSRKSWERERLREALAGYEMVKEVRGEGLLLGIEFASPRTLRLRVAFEAFMRIHPAMFGQIVVMRMFRDHGILTQICGNNFMVLKVAPPLVVTESQSLEFVNAARSVIDLMHHSTD